MHLAAPPLAAKESTDSSVPSILVVDDDPIFRGVVLRVLKLNNVTPALFSASDGSEAFDLIKRRRFDLVITDDQMPVMNGTELIRASRTLKADARPQFILCTANPIDEQSRTEQSRQSCLTVLEKPFPLSVLIEMVSRWARQEGFRYG